MKKIILILLICSTLIICGCPKYKTRPSNNFEKNQLQSQINNFLQDKQTGYFCGMSKKTVTVTYNSDKPPTYSCDTNTEDPNGKIVAQRIRNEAIDKSLTLIDILYEQYVDDLNNGRNNFNLAADLIELASSGAIGITNGERPIKVIGIVLTAFKGGRKSLDSNYFMEQSVPILINQMDRNRATIYASIYQKKKWNVDQYNMEEAIRDVVQYFNTGTLIRAFTELSKKTATAADEANENLLKLQDIDSLDKVATDEERIVVLSVAVQLRIIENQLYGVGIDDADKPTELAKAIVTLEKSTKSVVEKKGLFGSAFDETLKELNKTEAEIGTNNVPPEESLRFLEVLLEKLGSNVKATNQLSEIVEKSMD